MTQRELKDHPCHLKGKRGLTYHYCNPYCDPLRSCFSRMCVDLKPTMWT